MAGLAQDLRFASRALIRRPGFTLAVLVTLALGIGANTIVFSTVNALLLRPLPFAEPDRLVHLWQTNQRQGWNQDYVSFPNFLDWQEHSSVFEGLAAYLPREYNLSADERVEGVKAARVSANLFQLLGSEPAAGRGFAPQEDQPGQAGVAVLSHRLWLRRFGGDDGVVGRTITIQAEPHTVIGIMPPDFAFPLTTTDVWVPLALDRESNPRGQRLLRVVGRLASGVARSRAQAEMDVLAERLAQEHPDANADRGVDVVPLREGLTFSFGLIRIISLTVFLAAVFVLVLVCANVGGLVVARATAKSQELAVRSALGAGRWALIRSFLAECVLLTGLGAALGVVVAPWGLRFVTTTIPESLYRVGTIAIDRQALVFTLGLSLLIALVLAVIPGVRAFRPDLMQSLKDGTTASTSGFQVRRLYNRLVVFQVCMAVVLMIGAGLMIQSFLGLQKVDPGFEPRDVVTIKVVLPESKYGPERIPLFLQEAVRQLSAVPGVATAAAANFLPLNHETRWRELQLDRAATGSPEERFSAIEVVVSPEYFTALGIPIRRGRAFLEQDNSQTLPVAIVNEALARRLWPGEDPLGQRIALPRKNSEAAWLTIVGVAADTAHTGLGARGEPQFYRSLLQSPWRYMRLIARTRSDPVPLVPSAREAIWSIDRDLALTEVRTLGQVAQDWLLPQRATTRMLIVLALGALILATVGIYGLMAHSVALRTHEIGLRMALGAERRSIFRLILGQALRLTGIGLGIGLLLAVGMIFVMSSLLYGLSPVTAVTFASIVLVLLVAALAASFQPARQASRLQPLTALRYE